MLTANIGERILVVKGKMSYSDPDRQRAFCREWTRRRRALWFYGKICASCGSSANLELDHIDPSVKVTHRIWSWAPLRFAQEIAKCQVLCSACHREKTRAAASTRALAPCGTRAHYRSGCRCSQCRSANAKVEHTRRHRS